MLDVVAWAERFIATPSVSHDGNAGIAECAQQLLAEAGLEARLLPTDLDGVTHYTLIADAGPAPCDDGDGLLLLTHLDTVPPGEPSAWTATGGDPWNPVRDGDRLYGLGSADAKVDLVCKAAALAETDLARLRRPVRVVGTFAEEIGLVGARELVRSGALRGFRSALVGEPSELSGIVAHKGYAVFRAAVPLGRLGDAPGQVERIELCGKAAHSSTPHLGRNAIYRALERMAGEDVRGLVALEGGGAVNVVPGHCSLAISSEPAGHDPQPVLAFYRAWCALLESLA